MSESDSSEVVSGFLEPIESIFSESDFGEIFRIESAEIIVQFEDYNKLSYVMQSVPQEKYTEIVCEFIGENKVSVSRRGKGDLLGWFNEEQQQILQTTINDPIHTDFSGEYTFTDNGALKVFSNIDRFKFLDDGDHTLQAQIGSSFPINCTWFGYSNSDYKYEYFFMLDQEAYGEEYSVLEGRARHLVNFSDDFYVPCPECEHESIRTTGSDTRFKCENCGIPVPKKSRLDERISSEDSYDELLNKFESIYEEGLSSEFPKSNIELGERVCTYHNISIYTVDSATTFFDEYCVRCDDSLVLTYGFEEGISGDLLEEDRLECENCGSISNGSLYAGALYGPWGGSTDTPMLCNNCYDLISEKIKKAIEDSPEVVVNQLL